MSLVMHEEDDEDRLIIRTRIAAENSYTEQESTSLRISQASTAVQLFPEQIPSSLGLNPARELNLRCHSRVMRAKTMSGPAYRRTNSGC